MKHSRKAGKTARDFLEFIPNPKGRLPFVCEVAVEDFTHLCPITKTPDTAKLHIRWIADKHLVETRSLNEFLWSFRERTIFHEDVTHEVFDGLRDFLNPFWLQVVGRYVIRGTSWQTLVLEVCRDDAPKDEGIMCLVETHRHRLG